MFSPNRLIKIKYNARGACCHLGPNMIPLKSFWIYNLKALSGDLDLPFPSFYSHPACQFSLFQIIKIKIARCICPVYGIILFFLSLHQDHVYV